MGCLKCYVHSIVILAMYNKFHTYVHAFKYTYILYSNNQYYYNLEDVLSASKSFYVDNMLCLKGQ